MYAELWQKNGTHKAEQYVVHIEPSALGIPVVRNRCARKSNDPLLIYQGLSFCIYMTVRYAFEYCYL